MSGTNDPRHAQVRGQRRSAGGPEGDAFPLPSLLDERKSCLIHNRCHCLPDAAWAPSSAWHRRLCLPTSLHGCLSHFIYLCLLIYLYISLCTCFDVFLTAYLYLIASLLQQLSRLYSRQLEIDTAGKLRSLITKTEGEDHLVPIIFVVYFNISVCRKLSCK